MCDIVNKYFDSDDAYYDGFKLCEVSDNIMIMYTNAQSCANMRTHDEVKLFVQNCDSAMDIIIIAETWYNGNETQIYDIPGYTAIHSCRARRGGGLSMYVSSTCVIDDFAVIETTINAVSVEISNLKGISKLRIIGVYRPPARPNYEDMVTTIDSLLSNRSIKNTVVCGDFNINVNLATRGVRMLSAMII